MQSAFLFTNIPPLAKQVLGHEENADLNQAIIDAHQIPFDQVQSFMQVVRKVLLKTVHPQDLVQTLEHDLGLDAPAAVSLAIDLLGKRFLPMEFYLGPIAPLIRQLGGNPDSFLAEAQQRYPEVYNPQPDTTPEERAQNVADSEILKNFDERLEDFKGRAEVLLRITGLSSTIEDRMNADELPRDQGERLMADLEEIASAVDTRDLSHLERQRLRRKLARVVEAVGVPA